MSEIIVDQIIRAKRRTIALVIEPDGRIIVRAPRYVSKAEIFTFVHEKQNWLKKKLTEINARQQPKKIFTLDETHYFLGRAYSLQITEAQEIHLGDFLYVPQKFLTNLQDYLLTWYKKQARYFILQRVNFYSQLLLHASYRIVRITNARTSWGSCSPNGNLAFSWRLMMAPLDVIDYVVIHELCHLEHHNHSKKFWDKVAYYMPDYKKWRDWLKEHQALLLAM